MTYNGIKPLMVSQCLNEKSKFSQIQTYFLFLEKEFSFFSIAFVKLIITITTFSLENNSENTFRWTKRILNNF